MSILTQIQVVPVPTKAEKLAKVTAHTKFIAKRTYDDLVRIQKDGINTVWKNKEFTPQEIIDALGEDAINIFQFHGGLTDYLVAISAVDNIDYTPVLPTNAFTINDAGKIIVSDLPYELNVTA